MRAWSRGIYTDIPFGDGHILSLSPSSSSSSAISFGIQPHKNAHYHETNNFLSFVRIRYYMTGVVKSSGRRFFLLIFSITRTPEKPARKPQNSIFYFSKRLISLLNVIRSSFPSFSPALEPTDTQKKTKIGYAETNIRYAERGI